MILTEVPELNPLQLLVHTIVTEMWRQGYDSFGATDENILRVACTNPRAKEARNAAGMQWEFSEADQQRIIRAVRQNMHLRETHLFVFDTILHIVKEPCDHSRDFFCMECWEAQQKTKIGKRK